MTRRGTEKVNYCTEPITVYGGVFRDEIRKLIKIMRDIQNVQCVSSR